MAKSHSKYWHDGVFIYFGFGRRGHASPQNNIKIACFENHIPEYMKAEFVRRLNLGYRKEYEDA